MIIYLFVFIILAILVGIYAYRWINRVMEFYGVNTSKKSVKGINIILSAFVGVISGNIWSTGAMVMLHILVFAIVMDIAAFVFCRIRGSRENGKVYKAFKIIYRCGFVPILVSAIIFGFGYLNMGNVIKTEYSVVSDKRVKDYRVILITDTHYGTIQDTKILKEKIGEINEQHPDIVILGGDIVEENTTKESMKEVFGLLGSLESKYGVYFVYGNHDRQPYTSNKTYSNQELVQEITNNGIQILEDEYVEIDDDLILAGRADAAWGNTSGRASIEEILIGVNRDKYIIVADHQPIGAKENDNQKVDLELSGHTHAGQLFPIGYLSELTGTLNYGEYQCGSCKVIVSSGFAGWGYPVRTEAHCEYVVVNVSGK